MMHNEPPFNQGEKLSILNAVLAENNADDKQTDPNYSITCPNIQELKCRQKTKINWNVSSF